MTDTIRTVMTAEPLVVSADASVADTAAVMRDRGVGDVLVAQEDTVLGIVTDRDITVRATAAGKDPMTTPIRDCCSSDLVVVEADAYTGDVIRLLRDRAIRRAPVVEDGRIVGMVSLGDLARERDPDSALAAISAAPANH